MAKRIKRNLITGLDIGTSKVIALVGHVTSDGRIEIVGVGKRPSQGLSRGRVVNIEDVVASIQQAVSDAESMADCEIHTAYAGIAGDHISSVNSNGIVAVRQGEVSQDDIQRVLEAAKAIPIPADQEILHVLTRDFIIDDKQRNIRDPLGMSAVRLEANVHVITGDMTATQNITKCMQRCGLALGDVVLEQWASSFSVLTEDEKKSGVCLLDIGAGTTDIAVFYRGAISYTAALPLAGDQVTQDISMAFRIPTRVAEQLKLAHASASTFSLDKNDEALTLEDPVYASREISKRFLVRVVEARYEELFVLVKHQLLQQGFSPEQLAAGIVLTGGGAKIPGLVQLAEAIFRVPVRLGLPQSERIVANGSDFHDPAFATSLGLLLYGHQQTESGLDRPLQGLGVGSVWQRMKHWFQGNF